MVFQRIVVLALFCVFFERANSAHVRNVVVDFAQEDETFRGNLHVNGKAYPLKLKRPVDTVFAPSFRLTETIRAPSGKITLRNIPLSKSVSELERNIYVDEDANAAFAMEHVDGEMRLQGMMDNIHISHDGQGHVAAIQDFSALNFTSDYRSTGATWTKDDSVDDRAVAVANPELFFTIDNQHFTDLGRDDEKVPYYLAVMVRAVNNRYKTVSDPSIKFQLVGSTILKSRQAQPFIERSRGRNGLCDMYYALDKFAAYMYNLRRTNSRDLPQHDLAPLLSGEDYGDVGGLAFRGGACQDGILEDFRTMVSHRTSVNRDDKGSWLGVHTLAHELAHNMGSPHDGQKSQPGENPPFDTTACSWDDGYIMSYEFHERNTLTFSSCSRSYMKTFINSGRAECVKNNDAEQVYGEASHDPGYYVSMEEQCQKQLLTKVKPPCSGTVSTDKSADELCTQLTCVCMYNGRPSDDIPMKDRPLDGTLCGSSGGRCKEGRCVA